VSPRAIWGYFLELLYKRRTHTRTQQWTLVIALNAFERVRVHTESRLIHLRPFAIIMLFIQPSFPRESGTLHDRLGYCGNRVRYIITGMSCCRHVRLQDTWFTRCGLAVQAEARAHKWFCRHVVSLFKYVPRLLGHKGRNKITHVNVLQLSDFFF
jgi:hypothetical protein